MKVNYLRVLRHAMFAACALLVASCGDDEPQAPRTPDNPDQPDNPTVVDPDKPVADPAGTVTVNIVNDNNVISFGEGVGVAIDAGNNFRADIRSEIVNIGKVAGVGNIVEIPAAGWKSRTAVVPGDGYVLRYKNYGGSYTYARMYVVEFMESTLGGIMGATVKYQCPFQMPIKLSSKVVNFTAEGEEQTISLLNPTAVNVGEKPEWVNVSVEDLTIKFTAQENKVVRDRSGIVVLRNDEGEVQVSVSQAAALHNPLFAGGSGTSDDPYEVETAKQLDNVRLAPEAHFVQSADIDLDGYLNPAGNGWEPISDFRGTYDGAMHYITGLWINRPNTQYAGLFGSVNSATITRVRLKLTEAGIKCQSGACLAGYASNTTISQCSVEGSIYGTAGGCYGIAGATGYSSISECMMMGDVIAPRGLACGISKSGFVKNCCVIGNILVNEGYSRITYAFCDGAPEKSYIIGIYERLADPLNNNFCYGSQTLTEAQMKMQSTYENWDFVNVWKITEGVTYPSLRCFD